MFPAPQTKVEDDEGAEKQEREQRRTGRQVVHAPCPEILDFSLQHCTVGQVGDVHAPHIRQVVDVHGPHMRQVGVHAPQVWQVGDVRAPQIWQAGVVHAEVRVVRSLLATRLYQEWTSGLFSSWTRLRWSSLWTCASTWMRKRTS